MGGQNEQANNRDTRRAATVSTQRYVQSSTVKSWNDPPPNTMAENKCDTNADTCCLGKNFVVLAPTFRTADVYAYDMSISPIENVPIVTGATAYDDPITGNTYILVFHKSLYFGDKLDHTLINPNQVRSFGIPFWDNPFDPTRSLSIEVSDNLRIPLRTYGTKVAFKTRVPTADELEKSDHVHMTSAHPWNPTDISMLQATNHGGCYKPWKRQIATMHSMYDQFEYLNAASEDAYMDSIDPSLVRLGERLHQKQSCISQVETVYNQMETPAHRTFVSDERHMKVTAELIAEKFGISIPRAQRTLRVTTQRGVRSAILPISRRYRADRMFAVKRLNKKLATDTAYGKTKSLRGNVGSQLFSHKCGFKACYPLQKIDGNSVGDALT